MSYFHEQYRRPEWQKRRLEIMQRAKFKCQDCGAADKTLNVHHTIYFRDRKVWEYTDVTLRCLCEGCHVERHDTLDVIRVALGLLKPDAMKRVEGYVKGLLMKQHPQLKSLVHGGKHAAAGLADACSGVSDALAQAVFATFQDGRVGLTEVLGVVESPDGGLAARTEADITAGLGGE